MASNIARKSIMKRGSEIGVDWVSEVNKYENDFGAISSEYDKVFSNKITYPAYYTVPFHAYDEGNLSWKAAMEVQSAALTVHAHIYTGTPKILERNGDFKLRDNFHRIMKKMLSDKGVKPTKILDIG
eukprot:gene41680-55267_t